VLSAHPPHPAPLAPTTPQSPRPGHCVRLHRNGGSGGRVCWCCGGAVAVRASASGARSTPPCASSRSSTSTCWLRRATTLQRAWRSPPCRQRPPWLCHHQLGGEPNGGVNDAPCPPYTSHGASIRQPFGAVSDTPRSTTSTSMCWAAAAAAARVGRGGTVVRSRARGRRAAAALSLRRRVRRSSIAHGWPGMMPMVRLSAPAPVACAAALRPRMPAGHTMPLSCLNDAPCPPFSTHGTPIRQPFCHAEMDAIARVAARMRSKRDGGFA
jgi:hypothetical protein